MKRMWKTVWVLGLALSVAVAAGCATPQRAPGPRAGMPGVPGTDLAAPGARAADPDVVAGIERIATGGDATAAGRGPGVPGAAGTPGTPGTTGVPGTTGAGGTVGAGNASAIVVGNAAIIGLRNVVAGTTPAGPATAPGTTPAGAGATVGTAGTPPAPGGPAGVPGPSPAGTTAAGIQAGVAPGSTTTVGPTTDAAALLQRISAAYPFIREVHVTRDPAAATRIAAIATDLRAGRPISNHIAEIARLVQTIPGTTTGAATTPAAPGATTGGR